MLNEMFKDQDSSKFTVRLDKVGSQDIDCQNWISLSYIKSIFLLVIFTLIFIVSSLGWTLPLLRLLKTMHFWIGGLGKTSRLEIRFLGWRLEWEGGWGLDFGLDREEGRSFALERLKS